MRIYADTSFLVSLLYPSDRQHLACRAFFQPLAHEEWLTSAWSEFETLNSLRQLCLDSAGPHAATVEAIRRLFKHWHTRGPFREVETNLDVAGREARRMSATHATTLRMRAADVLHVALLEEINPDLFVTRDRDQHSLAVARAFPARLLA